jgi:alkylation response protein AidB-like acyl-CoA dehydrogenase
MLSVQIPIARFGTEEQKQRFLRPLCAGTCIGAHAMTEPDSGSDAFALRSTATKTTDGYVLNGRKTFITNAPVADLFLVFARTDPAAGIMGVSAFLVERSCEGVSIGAPMEKMGLRTSPMADVILEDCCVSVGDRIGSEGMGYAIFNASMAWERSLILACNLGAMERQLTRCIAYGNERKQFGLPIGKFQAIAHRIVDMKLRLDVARLLSYRAAATLTADENPTMEAAIAKLYVSEAWVQSCLDAIQIHGGYGYATEYEIERELRNAVSGTLYSGTSEIQRNIVAKALGL